MCDEAVICASLESREVFRIPRDGCPSKRELVDAIEAQPTRTIAIRTGAKFLGREGSHHLQSVAMVSRRGGRVAEVETARSAAARLEIRRRAPQLLPRRSCFVYPPTYTHTRLGHQLESTGGASMRCGRCRLLPVAHRAPRRRCVARGAMCSRGKAWLFRAATPGRARSRASLGVARASLCLCVALSAMPLAAASACVACSLDVSHVFQDPRDMHAGMTAISCAWDVAGVARLGHVLPARGFHTLGARPLAKCRMGRWSRFEP